MQFLFTVTYRGKFLLQFSPRRGVPQLPDGVVLGPGAPADVPVRVGDVLELRRPDGSVIRTRVNDLLQFEPRRRLIMVSYLILIHEVPRGTDVWWEGHDVSGDGTAPT